MYQVAKGAFSKHERSDRFDSIKQELMAYLKQDAGLAETDSLPDLTKKISFYLLWRSTIRCSA